MKKLMIAAAIVCAAAFAQAAQVNWSASGVYAYGSTTQLYSGLATIHVLNASGTEVYSTSATMTSGTISPTLVQSDDIIGGAQHQFYYVMTDKDGNVFTSNTRKMNTQATQTPTLNFGAGGSWTAAPEPTSGLLLLLGVGALALRRRRA